MKHNAGNDEMMTRTVPVELDARAHERVEHRRLHVQVVRGAVPARIAPAVVVNLAHSHKVAKESLRKE